MPATAIAQLQFHILPGSAGSIAPDRVTRSGSCLLFKSSGRGCSARGNCSARRGAQGGRGAPESRRSSSGSEASSSGGQAPSGGCRARGDAQGRPGARGREASSRSGRPRGGARGRREAPSGGRSARGGTRGGAREGPRGGQSAHREGPRSGQSAHRDGTRIGARGGDHPRGGACARAGDGRPARRRAGESSERDRHQGGRRRVLQHPHGGAHMRPECHDAARGDAERAGLPGQCHDERRELGSAGAVHDGVELRELRSEGSVAHPDGPHGGHAYVAHRHGRTRGGGLVDRPLDEPADGARPGHVREHLLEPGRHHQQAGKSCRPPAREYFNQRRHPHDLASCRDAHKH